MTTIAEVQTAIRDGIRSLGATPSPLAVYWTDEPMPAAKVLVSLDIVSMGALQDRVTFDTDGDHASGVDWDLSTLYYLRVQVRAESIYNSAGHDALFTLEKIRAGLRRPDLVWGAGVVNQPDTVTYVHHVSFPHEGRTISAYAFETGFRAVLDFPGVDGDPIGVGPGLQEVMLDGDADVGEVALQQLDQTIARP